MDPSASSSNALVSGPRPAPMPADNFTSRLTSFEEVTGHRADGPDVWLSWLGATPFSNTLPGIPKNYLQAVLEGRALYVVGIPIEWQSDFLKDLFSHVGEVDCCPCVIDLRSHGVFRWIIMKTAAQATMLMRSVNTMEVKGPQMRFYRAVPPGVTITFSEEFPIQGFRSWEVLPPWLYNPLDQGPNPTAGPEPADSGHSNAPIAPALPQSPGAASVQPATTPTANSLPALLAEGAGVIVAVQPPTPPRAANGGTPSGRAASPALVEPPTPPRAINGGPPPLTWASGPEGAAQQPTPPSAHGGLVAPTAHQQQPGQQPQAGLQQHPSAPRSSQQSALDGFVPQAVTWANIVSARGGPSVDARQQLRQPSSRGPRLHPVGRIPPVIRRVQVPIEPMAEQMRVVFLLNVQENVTLMQVSDAVKEGSLHSIRFGIDEKEKTRYCGIVFQNASDAELFFKIITKERTDYKPSRFSFIAKTARGPAFPADQFIKAMGAPVCASRRLTVVKSRFFFHYKEAQFKELCERLVGADQVQYIWLYNGGNATVIFADVESAMKVKAELERLARLAGRDESRPFSGLHVSFSKDPCLQELQFVTDLRE